MSSGKYIVIEGPEGVGKSTQIMELTRRLQAAGLPVRTLREPDSQSSLTARAIRQITQDPHYPLNTRTEVLLYNAARSQSLDVIRNSIAQGVTCVVDRNYLTTLAIQYYGRGDVPDYQTITNIISFAVGGLEPDLCIVLDAPVPVLKERLKGRGAGERFDNLDEAFLERVRAGYLWEANHRGFPVIYATDTESVVANAIWQEVTKVLALRKSTSSNPTSVASVIAEHTIPHEPPVATLSVQTDLAETLQLFSEEQPLLDKTSTSPKITAAGNDYLHTILTNTTDSVYAFTPQADQIMVAAAMARLSRRGDDLRVTLLDEFAGKQGKDQKLLQRVITAYGDDSVQQLVGQHVVIENASNLLTKKLEWGRLASYLEQSTRYIYFDQKDQNDKYRYFTPALPPELTKRYETTMNQIFDTYSIMVHTLTDYLKSVAKTPSAERDGAWQGAIRAQACDAIRAVLPVATTSTVGIYASAQALESLIMHLQSDTMAEARTTGDTLLVEARKTIPTFLERADKPDRGGAWIAYQAATKSAMRELTTQLLPNAYDPDDQKTVTLTDFWPRNELSIIPDILYEYSNQSLSAIRSTVETWSYEQKVAVLKTTIGERLNRRHRPGRAFEKIHYSWDIICDYGIFRDLQRHRMVDDLEWQSLSPYYGYEMPKLVLDAGLAESFEACFDQSMELFSALQGAGFGQEAQYATLFGHRMRWKVTYNAREAFHLHELRTSPQGHPGYRRLVQEMHQTLATVHPLIAEAMKFVNQGEDAELTRLAAERYTQFKLSQLT